MIAVESNALCEFLSRQDEETWDQTLLRLMPGIHPVDQPATRVWFAFWPLKLSQALQSSSDPVRTAKDLKLDGNYRLDEQLNSSVKYFFASRFWSVAKHAVLEHAETAIDCGNLEAQIRNVAGRVAAQQRTEDGFVLGITAVAFMVLQQLGLAAFARAAQQPAEIRNHKSADQLLSERQGNPDGGLLSFLRFGKKPHTVTFDESSPECTFQAFPGQDLSMASSSDKRDHKLRDDRCIAGPIPAECRSGACGYCWVGILGGRENLSEMTEFEKKRLKSFGYATLEHDLEKRPCVRLACQAKCYGAVSLVVPPWNGVLDGSI